MAERFTLYQGTDHDFTVTLENASGDPVPYGVMTAVVKRRDGTTVTGGESVTMADNGDGTYTGDIENTLPIVEGEKGWFEVTVTSPSDLYARFPWFCKIKRT